MDAEENELLTRVGPGTAAGDTLRKYWLPVGFSHEHKSDAPRLVRWLGEDMILFRDESGRVGLIEPMCAHRGTSLEYGWIEAGGLRCCYHGWVYDVNGRCIEQPGEPPGSDFKNKIKLKSYPVRELGGIIWAYMGKGAPPELNNYHFLVREDGERVYAGYVRECNYLQQLENALDPVHATVLHGRPVEGRPAAPEWMERPEFEVAANDSMAYYVARRTGPRPGTEWHREVAYLPPIMVVHDGGSLPGDPEPAMVDVSWRMPIDDFSTRSFTLRIHPKNDGKPWRKEQTERARPAPLMRGTRKQYDMATINGQDTAAQVGQGAIVDRPREHLGHSDRGVIQVRKLWRETIEANLRGEEPPNLVRDTAKNRIIHVDVIEKLVKRGEMKDHVPRIIHVER
ncbi:MAG TPA: Rieske 2Fe-2S domain-containing protein [Candidatus Binatia bacterium]|nr:Rieske 2Fe-2S domain-containing protein [Candidatus Binatia bacterium]